MSRSRPNNVVLACIAIGLLGTAMVGVSVYCGSSVQKESLAHDYWAETFKTGLGGLIVAVLTVLLSEVVKDKDIRNQASIRRSEVLLTMLTECGEAYRGAKGVRRSVRARLLRGKDLKVPFEPNDLAIYEEAVKELNRYQLALESLHIQVQGVSTAPPELCVELGKMEKYLGKVTEEFEGVYVSIKFDALSRPSLPKPELPRLLEFIMHKDDKWHASQTAGIKCEKKPADLVEDLFSAEFAKPYAAAWKAIYRHIATRSDLRLKEGANQGD